MTQHLLPDPELFEKLTVLATLPDLTGKPRHKFEHWNIVAFRRDPIVVHEIASGSSQDEAEPLVWPRVENLRRVLSQYQFPVALDIPIFRDSTGFTCNWTYGPDITMPTKLDLSSWTDLTNSGKDGDGWHAIAICGYDDALGRLQFKNSWGPMWGDIGFGTIPYDYVERFSRIQIAGWVGPPSGLVNTPS